MIDTEELIARLTSEAKPAKPVSPPANWSVLLLTVLLLYAAVIQIFLGIRSDLSVQLARPTFTMEILLLCALAISSIIASILVMYPDSYQKPKLLSLPYIIFLLLSILMITQLFLPTDPSMVFPPPGAHAMECALCIGAVSLVPSALIFAILRRGASIHPLKAGSFAVLAASAIGCLTLRLAEDNDSIIHLLLWHYLPTIIFASLGAFIGKHLLKW